jgi:peptidoglycan hydrolase-like protein with peptidoglycan-binding domain
MTTWRSILALAAAGAFVTGPAFAQGGGTTSPSGGEQTKPGGTDQGATKPSEQSSPSASPSTAPGEKSQADKPVGGEGQAQGEKAAGGGGQQQVKAAQQALKDKGQDPGPVDGVMGPKTQAALKAFQQAEGLTATGRLDAETMAKLGVSEAGGSSPAASPAGESSTPKAEEQKGQQQGTEQKKGQQQ